MDEKFCLRIKWLRKKSSWNIRNQEFNMSNKKTHWKTLTKDLVRQKEEFLSLEDNLWKYLVRPKRKRGGSGGQERGEKETTMTKTKNSVWDLWDTLKLPNSCVFGVPRGVERDNGLDSIFSEIIAENFTSLEKKKRSSLWHILLKLSKVMHKGNILKCLKSPWIKCLISFRGEDLQLNCQLMSLHKPYRVREWRDIV